MESAAVKGIKPIPLTHDVKSVCLTGQGLKIIHSNTAALIVSEKSPRNHLFPPLKQETFHSNPVQYLKILTSETQYRGIIPLQVSGIRKLEFKQQH